MNKLLMIPTLIFGAILGYLFARGAKGLGQKVAVTRHTNTGSVNDTIDGQVRLFGKAGLTAILLLIAAAGLVIFVPSTGTSWAPMLGKVVGFAANIALGFAAGVGANVARILSIPAVRDGIDCQIDMKRRTRRHLKKFLSILLLGAGLLSAATAVAHASETTWALVIDRTASVDPGQREAAVNALLESALDKAQKLNVSAIQVVKFDQEVMLSDMTWIPVPKKPVFEDCRKARPAPVMEEGFMPISLGLAMGRKQQAVNECLKRQTAQQKTCTAERQAFRERLQASVRVTPRSDVTTRIVPLLQLLAEKQGVLAIDLVTDGIDHSRMPLDTLRIPEGLTVTLIITRPNPARAKPTVDDVLAAARAWSQVPGITVIGVREYIGLSQALKGIRP